MKSKSLILFFIFVIIAVLAFFTVQITNRNIKLIYKKSHATTFQLLSEIADDYVKRDFRLNRIEVNNLRDEGRDILRDYLESGYIPLNENIDGVWIFRDSVLKGLTRFPEREQVILDFYSTELKSKDYGTLINLEGEPFYLVNLINGDYSILLLSKSTYGETGGITKVLDSLVSFSNLVYFAIIDKNGSPVVYSSLYEGFLPVEGEGSHIIETPRGKIFQLEKERNGKIIIAGLSMVPLEHIIRINELFLLLVIAGFSVFLGFLLFNLSKSEKYRISKEREIKHLEEIGALSSGFSHEIRNSLNTLSLLTRNLKDEEGDILKEEVERMNLVMDSLKLLILSEIDKEMINLDETIVEAISLIGNYDNSVDIKFEADEKLKIHGNRSLLVSAFSNIIKNAIEAGADKIRILEKKKGNDIRVGIIDNGRGMNTDETTKVFEPFYSNKKQSGLGLYLVRKIIDYHGGSIKIESDRETEVDIFLPLKE